MSKQTYKGISELHKRLLDNKIPHTYKKAYDGMQIEITNQKGKKSYSVIEHKFSYGLEGCDLRWWNGIEPYLSVDDAYKLCVRHRAY